MTWGWKVFFVMDGKSFIGTGMESAQGVDA